MIESLDPGVLSNAGSFGMLILIWHRLGGLKADVRSLRGRVSRLEDE